MESWERIAEWMKSTHPDDLFQRSGRLANHGLPRSEHAWRVLNIVPLGFLRGSSGAMDSKVFRSAIAFLMYQWDASHAAGLSLGNALTASYNEAYVLLRSFLELFLNGVLFQCLAQRRFRETPSASLKPTDSLSIFAEQLWDSINRGEIDALELEANSAGIFEYTRRDWSLSAFGLQMNGIVRQIADWGVFSGMENDPAEVVSDLYGRLSANVHARIQHTNVGRAVEEGAEIFEWPAPVLAQSLSEFLDEFHLDLEDLASP